MGKHSSEEKKQKKEKRKEKQEKQEKETKSTTITSVSSSAEKPGKAKRTSKAARAVRQKRRPTPIGAPKKPLTAYNLFAGPRREALKQQLPFFSFAELSKAVADEWNVLPDAQKAPFMSAAKTAHDAYLEEKKKWEAANGITRPEKKKTAKAE